MRDAAYEALLRSRRKDLHRRARAIDGKFPSLKEKHPEVLARHWTEAGETEQAIAQRSRAGKMAETRNAFLEAQESYQQVLQLLNLLPESPDRDLREVRFRQSLVSMLHMTSGWATAEAVEVVERAALLAKKNGNLRQLIGTLAGRCLHAYIAADLSIAGALADQALDLCFSRRRPHDARARTFAPGKCALL